MKLINCETEDIAKETVDFYSYPENYNKIIQEQLKYLDINGHWLESKKYVDEFLKIV